jgi:hypothetical protein
MAPLSLTQKHINILSTIPRIKDGKVELFVRSTYKRKRWFDTYICIWYGYDYDCDAYEYDYEETKEEPEENRYVKKVIYELDYDQSYHQLSDSEIEDLLL